MGNLRPLVYQTICLFGEFLKVSVIADWRIFRAVDRQRPRNLPPASMTTFAKRSIAVERRLLPQLEMEKAFIR